MIVNLISSPRNISTALMYAFSNRGDCKVVDEPFYAWYLDQSGADHPGRQEIIDSLPVQYKQVIDMIEKLEKDHEIVFVKNMAHHLVGMPVDFLKTWQNVFLIRDPRQLITSFVKVISDPDMKDIGVARQAELFDLLCATQSCPVIDSNEVLKDPGKILSQLCAELRIPWTFRMLEWNPGAIPEDGVWAKFWYKNVHQSTGFMSPSRSDDRLPEHCRKLYDEALPFYQKLRARAIVAGEEESH